MILGWNYDYKREIFSFEYTKHGKILKNSMDNQFPKILIKNQIIHPESIATFNLFSTSLFNKEECNDLNMVIRDAHGIYHRCKCHYNLVYDSFGEMKAVGTVVSFDIYWRVSSKDIIQKLRKNPTVQDDRDFTLIEVEENAKKIFQDNVTEENYEDDVPDFLGKRVLIVDDNDVNLEISTHILKKTNCDIDVAKNGSLAVNMIFKSRRAYYDIVLMDIQMPVLDGLQATKLIRMMQRMDTQRMPIIAISVDDSFESIAQLRKCGMNGFIPKPLNPDNIYNILNMWLQ